MENWPEPTLDNPSTESPGQLKQRTITFLAYLHKKCSIVTKTEQDWHELLISVVYQSSLNRFRPGASHIASTWELHPAELTISQ